MENGAFGLANSRLQQQQEREFVVLHVLKLEKYLRFSGFMVRSFSGVQVLSFSLLLACIP